MDRFKQPRSLHTASLLANVQQDLQILFKSISEALLLIEADGTILAANDVSAKWLNRSVESLINENLFQLHTTLEALIRERVQTAINEKTIIESDTWMGKRFVHLRFIPITDGAQVTRLIMIGQDVTEQKRVEEQVREFTEQMDQKVRERTAKLEALNRQLTEEKRRAELLASLSQYLIQEAHDYSHLLEEITTQISGLIGDICLIALFTSDLTMIEVQAITDRSDKSLSRQRAQLLNRPISVEANIIANHMLKGEKFSAHNISREKGKELFPPEFTALLGKDGLSALEVFPLQAGDHPLGMLAIARDHGAPYTEDDISFVSSLASPIALAIQNASLFSQLSESQNQLRGLSKRLVQMQENQYSLLAEELHDRVGQDMTAININLNILRTLLPRTIPKGVISRLADTENLVKESVKRMRSTMAEFCPPMLDQYGLTAALYWYGEQYHHRTKIKVTINDRYMKNIRLPAEIEIALFRISQEALNNVAKHANATQVNIELFEEHGDIMIAITDNGVGFDVQEQGSKSPEHWGLTLMRERARAIDGEFLLRSIPGQGTQIVVRVRRANEHHCLPGR